MSPGEMSGGEYPGGDIRGRGSDLGKKWGGVKKKSRAERAEIC